MDNIVDLTAWRQARDDEPAAEEPLSTSAVPTHPSMPGFGGGAARASVDRLDRAVRTLQELVSRVLNRAGQIDPRVETELLAIMGELTMDLVQEAAVRAERLAARLATEN